MTTTQPGSYAPRDVINAPQIKSAIRNRSQQRQDPKAVSDWLLNHFFRHVIGNLKASAPALQVVRTEEQALSLLEKGNAPAPEWLRTRFKRNTLNMTPLYWIDPEGETLLELETRLVEFLNSRKGTNLEGKLMRINCMQAISLWSMEHAAFEANLLVGLRNHNPEAVKAIWGSDTGIFVEFLPNNPLLRAEMAYESQVMQHCLGQFSSRRNLTGGYGEHYASACEAGRLRLFSFRSGQNKPHITISALTSEDGRLTIDQIKGKQNRPPIERYKNEVIRFLNTLPTNTTTPADAIAMGIACTPRGWLDLSSIDDPMDQLYVIKRHPQFVRSLPNPAPLIQWLVAGQEPELLEGLPLTPAVARALGAQK